MILSFRFDRSDKRETIQEEVVALSCIVYTLNQQ